MTIFKSYHLYFSVINKQDFRYCKFLKNSYFDYIFKYPTSFPNYIKLGICDILPNKNGILFTQHVLQQFEPNEILIDFEACFSFNLPIEICDNEQSRYKNNYTFDFDIDELKKEVPMDLILQYEDSAWKPILEIDPDFFYLRNNEQILLGSKDYKQVEYWINEINTANTGSRSMP